MSIGNSRVAWLARSLNRSMGTILSRLLTNYGNRFDNENDGYSVIECHKESRIRYSVRISFSTLNDQCTEQRILCEVARVDCNPYVACDLFSIKSGYYVWNCVFRLSDSSLVDENISSTIVD